MLPFLLSSIHHGSGSGICWQWMILPSNSIDELTVHNHSSPSSKVVSQNKCVHETINNNMGGNDVVWNATWGGEKWTWNDYTHLCCFVFHILSVVKRSGRFTHMPGPDTGVGEPQGKSQSQKLSRMTWCLKHINYLERNLNGNEYFYVLPHVHSFSSSEDQFSYIHQKS